MENINHNLSFQKGKTSTKLASVNRSSLGEMSKNSKIGCKIESSFSGKHNSYKLELITQNFTDNYEDLISSLAMKAKSPKNHSKFSLKNAFSELSANDIELNNKYSSINGTCNNDGSKTEIKKLISNCEKKKTEEEKPEIHIDNLTNREDIKDFYLYTEECLRNIKKINLPTNEQIEKLYINDFPFIKELKNKKLAVFDLDETLVHCETRDLSKGEIPIYVNINSGTKLKKHKITINVRPFLIDSLKKIKNNYIIVVYTASHKFYADPVLDFLDPKNEIFSYRLYRENCLKVKMGEEEIYVKDLRIFKHIDLKKIVIIDNSVLSFAFQIDNGIPILPFYDNKKDSEMLILVNYLKHLSKVEDVRKENRKFLKMEYFFKKANNEIDDSENEDTPESSSLTDCSPINVLILNPCEVMDPIELSSSLESNNNIKLMSNVTSKLQKELKSLILKENEDFKKIFST